jgi:hypothetical protein
VKTNAIATSWSVLVRSPAAHERTFWLRAKCEPPSVITNESEVVSLSPPQHAEARSAERSELDYANHM